MKKDYQINLILSKIKSRDWIKSKISIGSMLNNTKTT